MLCVVGGAIFIADLLKKFDHIAHPIAHHAFISCNHNYSV